eukprot:TCONS_00010039-protein
MIRCFRNSPHSTTSIKLTDTSLSNMYRTQPYYVNQLKSRNITKSQSALESYARSLPPIKRFSVDLMYEFWGVDDEDLFGTNTFKPKNRSQFLEQLQKVKEKFTFSLNDIFGFRSRVDDSKERSIIYGKSCRRNFTEIEGNDLKDFEKYYNEKNKSDPRFLGAGSSHLPPLNCTPGHYKAYGKVTQGFSWTCLMCKENYFKSEYGNQPCKKCTGKTSTANKARNACIDPYQEVYINQNSQEFVIVLTLCCIGFAMTLVVLIIFITKRTTPIVTISDFQISTIHLVDIILIFAISPVIFFIQPTNAIHCLFKPILNSSLYVVSIGIIFIKTQKILKAFLSKVIITSREIKKTTGEQIFTIFVFLGVVNLAFAVSVYYDPAKILKIENSQTLQRNFSCNTYFHSSIIMGFELIIQLLCSIQAFRGRNLPSVMNESMILVYTTFVLTAVFMATFAIVPFQKPWYKEIAQCIGIIVNNTVIMVLLYGQKAYRIIRYPAKNTKSYFRESRMKSMSVQSESVM